MDKIIVGGSDSGDEDNRDEDNKDEYTVGEDTVDEDIVDEDIVDEDNGEPADMDRHYRIHNLHTDSRSREVGELHGSHSEVEVHYNTELQHLELPLKKVQ